jgi:hypothetical protein
LKEGTLSINRAHQLCKLPKVKQLEQFVSYSEDRATNRVIRRSIPQPKEKKASVDVLAVLDVLQRQEAQQPGSVAVRVGRHKRMVVLIGDDLSSERGLIIGLQTSSNAYRPSISALTKSRVDFQFPVDHNVN